MRDDMESLGFPKALLDMYDEVVSLEEPVDRFRAYVEILIASKVVQNRAEGDLRGRHKALRAIEEETKFINRHKARHDNLARAMRNTYASPKKALETFNDLCRNYQTDYVLDVAKLGSYRFGRPRGVSLLGMKTGSRVGAEENYEKTIFPLIEEIVPDHRDYLQLVGGDLDKLHSEVQEKITDANTRKLAIDGLVRDFQLEQKNAAIAIAPEGVASLAAHEQKMRLDMLPDKQRAAELEQEQREVRR